MSCFWNLINYYQTHLRWKKKLIHFQDFDQIEMKRSKKPDSRKFNHTQGQRWKVNILRFTNILLVKAFTIIIQQKRPWKMMMIIRKKRRKWMTVGMEMIGLRIRIGDWYCGFGLVVRDVGISIYPPEWEKTWVAL